MPVCVPAKLSGPAAAAGGPVGRADIVEAMSTYDLVADLPVHIEDYELEGLVQDVSSDFERKTTIIDLRGGGEEGLGEDVVYDAVDHEIAQQAGPTLPLAGDWTIRSFSEHLSTLELFPETPVREVSQLYRVWAYESAALDLALRQAGRSLHEVLGRTPQPLTFVVSLRLGEPPSLEPVTRRLEHYPTLRFKLDPTPSWDAELIAGLVQTGAVDSVDFKGLYEGTVVDNPADPDFYLRVIDAFPDAWIEDPKLTPQIDEALEPHRDRITWDANVHSIDDIEGLPFAPRMVNLKPSRLGGVKPLLDAYDYTAERGIGAYGGGQFELGVGRGQIQYLASIFHPGTPNDTSPSGFHVIDPPPGLPTSPLAPAASATASDWG
jgi:L-alanine-DL-glutamate epimerase-like enolase superfamily enzyme